MQKWRRDLPGTGGLQKGSPIGINLHQIKIRDLGEQSTPC